MPEFHNDEQRDTYVDGLLREQDEAVQQLAAAKEAGKEAKEIEEHIASVKSELSRVGVTAEEKKDAAEKRPSKPAAETR